MSQEFDRRSFLARSAVAGAGVVAAGGAAELIGADIAGAVQTNGRGLDGISNKRPKRGGSVTIGLDAEEQGFNPTTGRFDTSGFMYARTVFDPIMIIDATGQAQPYLAESMVPNADYTAWTINLKPNIKFHDGTPLDGAALLLNVDKAVTGFLTGVALRPLIASYSQTGPLAVTINMKNPWVQFPYTMAQQQVCFVAAPSMINAPNGGSDHPVGTGPFKFKEWIPNDHFTAVANTEYWRPGLPYLSSITYKPIPDEQARLQALESGTIQMMHTSDATNVKTLYGNKSYAFTDNIGRMVGEPNCNCVMLNCGAAPFNDINARRIVATGVSAAAYNKIMDQGVGGPINGIYLSSSPYYTPTAYPKFNESEAKKLASQYKQKHGKPLSFTIQVVAAPQNIRQGEYLQQVMKNIGVEVTVKSVQQNDLINNAIVGSFQATEWSQFGTITPDLNYVWFSPTTYSSSGISINMARNVDPQIEQAFLAGMATKNRQKQIAAFAKINQRLGADIPYVWTDRTFWGLASHPNVQNWNNPTTPAGHKALGQDQGPWWPTQMWVS